MTLPVFDRRVVRMPGSRTVLLRYYIFASAANDSAQIGDNAYPTVYSLYVQKQQKGSIAESAFFYDITRLPQKARSLLRLLSANTVTPASIPDVLEDWL